MPKDITTKKRLFRRLLKVAACYNLNTGAASLDEVKKKVLEVIEKA